MKKHNIIALLIVAIIALLTVAIAIATFMFFDYHKVRYVPFERAMAFEQPYDYMERLTTSVIWLLLAWMRE